MRLEFEMKLLPWTRVTAIIADKSAAKDMLGAIWKIRTIVSASCRFKTTLYYITELIAFFR